MITFLIQKGPELISNDGTMPHHPSRTIPMLILIAVIKDSLMDHSPQDGIICGALNPSGTMMNFVTVLSGTHCKDPQLIIQVATIVVPPAITKRILFGPKHCNINHLKSELVFLSNRRTNSDTSWLVLYPFNPRVSMQCVHGSI